MRAWEHTPPPSQMLRRIARLLGDETPDPRKAAQSKNDLATAATLGIPISTGELPKDRELDLIDAPLGATLESLRVH